MNKLFERATAHDLNCAICNLILEDKTPEFWRSDTCDKLFNGIWQVAKEDALHEQPDIIQAIERVPYLKDFYKNVSTDAARRGIYHEAVVKCHPRIYEKKKSDVEQLVDKIYQASPMFVFVSSTDMQYQLNKEAVESAARAYKQKIHTMVYDWATAVYEKAFWAEIRKVIDKAMD